VQKEIERLHALPQTGFEHAPFIAGNDARNHVEGNQPLGAGEVAIHRECYADAPEWITDPKFATPDARIPHLFDVYAAVEAWTIDKDKHEVVEIMRKYEIPCGPVLTTKELLHDESLRANGSIVAVEHKERGTYYTVGCPPKFSGFTPTITASPLLGEHNEEVLLGLGYSKDQIASLREKKVI
jgi:formyl-CoA transferase